MSEKTDKRKKYFGSKALVILLSFIILFNGLGLIVAGKRVNKKNWIICGSVYIFIEWIASLTGIGVILATILYFESIIHTALICDEYGRLLRLKEEMKNSEGMPLNNMSIIDNVSKTYIQVDDKEYVDGADNLEHIRDKKIVSKDEHINIDSLNIGIGIVNVQGEKKDKLKISIRSETGKMYEFITNGNDMEAFVLNGKIYNYGG